MITFGKIAGGAPSSVADMGKHLLTQTVSREHAALAAYYAKGQVDRDKQNHAHYEAWIAGRVAPDLPKLAEFAAMPDAPPDLAQEIEWKLATDLDLAIRSGAMPPLTPEARVLHGISEPPEVQRYLRGLSLEDLQARRAGIEALWDHAITAAMYREDTIAAGDYENMPLGVVRQDLHPIAAIGLGINMLHQVNPDQINALLVGRRADGTEVVGKHYAKERRLPVDPNTAERRWSTPIGSYDFTASADKSVSVAWAFAPEVEQAQIYNAHIEASREAVAYIATEVGQARIGKAGIDGFESGHVAWVEFTHHTSRKAVVFVEDGDVKVNLDKALPGDPDLHTHFLMPNAVFCESGRVGSLDTASIKGFLFEATAYYHARLATHLREAGFEVELDDRNGVARMAAIPSEVRTLFSKRKNLAEVLARKFTTDRGEVWEDLTDEQRSVRVTKSTHGLNQKVAAGKDDMADFQNWKEQAEAIGWQAPASLQFIGPPERPLTREERHQKAYAIGLPWLEERLGHSAVVPHWDLRLAALRGLIHTGTEGLHDIGGVTKIMRTDGVRQYSDHTALIWGQEEGQRYTSVTTALHERDENEFVELMRAAYRDKSGAIPSGLLRAKLDSSGLDFTTAHGEGQRKAIERVATGGRFGLVIAAAGAGKTTSLKPMVQAWKEQWRDVHGASLAWRQADDLVDAGIDKRNIKAFSVLMKALAAEEEIKAVGQHFRLSEQQKDEMAGGRNRRTILTENSVVAIDEWGLLGTRQGLELLRHRDRLGFTIVALGDDKQTASIEAGAIIDLSRRALGADNVPAIQTTIRQQTDREKQIVGLLREGRAAEALDMKRADGTAEMAYGGRDGVIRRVAEIYAERIAATGIAPTISAPTNSDAHQISEAVRLERRKQGSIGPDLFVVKATDGERDYLLRLGAGDHVRLFKSTGADYGEGKGGSIGRNGSVLEVVDANAKGLTLKGANGKVGRVNWKDLRADKDQRWNPGGTPPSRGARIKLAYGDAMTIHTAQGSTAQEHIFALPGGSQAVTGAQAYTASSRHRTVAYMVTSEAAERIAVRESRPINDTHDITIDDKWANVAKALSHKPKSDSALEMLDRVVSLKRGAVKSYQEALRPTGLPCLASEVVQRRQIDISLAIARGVDRAKEVYRTVVTGIGMSR